MDETTLRELLTRIRDGHCEVDDGLAALRDLPFSALPYATLDHHRSLRTGLPEVVFAQGKATDHLLGIVAQLVTHGEPVLVTRLTPEQAQALQSAQPALQYNALARTGVITQPATVAQPNPTSLGTVAIVTAGTADLAVAEEAAVTAELFGNRVRRINDVGVAGLQRILSRVDELRASHVVIVVAGMDGALASVVAGLIDRPLIAVPTSIGYGASFQGLAPLLTMLSSCSAGVTVVNIDNGFGAAHAATLINRGRTR